MHNFVQIMNEVLTSNMALDERSASEKAGRIITELKGSPDGIMRAKLMVANLHLMADAVHRSLSDYALQELMNIKIGDANGRL